MVQTRAQSRAQKGLARGHAKEEDKSQGISRKSDNDPSSPRGHVQIPPAKANPRDPIDFWRKQGHWPKHLFDPGIERVHAIRGARPRSVVRKGPNSTIYIETASDQRPRNEKNDPYLSPSYDILLEAKGILMHTASVLPAEESLQICKTLLQTDQPVPRETILDDAFANISLDKLHGKNEARVIQDLSRLLVPSAESLARYDSCLSVLVESVNEGWNSSVPLVGPRPQPDYAVGFGRTTFSEEQLKKLEPLVGDILDDSSFILGTRYMYLPFLTCEVKCGLQALDVADRQNAHSTALAVRGVADFFRALGRGDEVNRQILAWSVSHNHEMAKIYGHFPVIEGEKMAIHRHPVRICLLCNPEDRWIPYRFTRNLYDIWMPQHLARLRSGIDQIPSESTEALSHNELIGSPPALGRPAAATRLESEPSAPVEAGESHGEAGSSTRSAIPLTTNSGRESTKKRKKGDS